MKALAKKYLSTLFFFYRFLRYRVYILLFLSMGVALFDSIGLAMFIPLLGKATSGFDFTGQLGHLHVLMDFMRTLGFNFSLGGVLLVIAILFTVKGVFRFLEDFYRVRMRLVFMKSVRIKLIDGLTSFRFSAFTNANGGEIQNIMTVEVNQAILAFEHYFRAAQGIMTTIIYLTLAFITSPQFALLVMAAGILSNILYQRIYRYTKKLSRTVTQKGHIFHSLLLQQVHHFKYLKATSRIRIYAKKLKDKVEEIEESQLQIGKLNAILFGSRETIATIVVILVIFIKVRFMGGLITAMLLSLMFFYRALGAVLMVQNNWNLYLGNSGSIESINYFLSELDQKKDQWCGKIKISNVESIDIENLSFSYGGNNPVISGLNLNIKTGETIAIVGESGSGKTTLMNLVAGLLDEFQGQIKINSIPLKNIEFSSWHQSIAYVTQEPVVFDDTLVNNVTFWDDLSVDENRLRYEQALKQASLWDFVQTLPDKDESLIGHNGVKISGGQKQRISIARELYRKNISLVLLDEATSSLDSETERNVQTGLDLLSKNHICIIIAHRLTTIRKADKIVLLHKGKIDRIGQFSELQETSTRFKEMVELQEF